MGLTVHEPGQDLGRSLPRGLKLSDLVGLALVVAGVLLVTTIPYAFAYRTTPAGKVFMGILLNVPDTAQYLSWAREFGHHLLIENKLTSEHGAAVYFNLFWLFVGRIAQVFHLALPVTLQIVRLVASIVYLGTMYWFIGLVTRDRLERWISFLVVTFGGGLGWALIVLKQVTHQVSNPLDLYVYEPNSFLTVLAFPHQAFADGFLLLVLGLFVLASERRSLRLSVLAGFLALALGLQHGYDLVIVYAVLGTTALTLAIRDRDVIGAFRPAVVTGLISAPAALYLVLLSRLSPIWRGALSQYGNAGVFTPSPLNLLVLMGVPLILVVASTGEKTVLQKTRTRDVMLTSWLVAGFILLYLPTDFQIKMLGGWQVPVGIVATRVTLTQIAPNLPALLKKLGIGSRFSPQFVAGCLLIAAILPTNLYLYAWRFVDLGRHDSPYYLSQGEVDALSWLEANSKPSDVVLSSLTVGEYIPSVSGNSAFLAHWAMTLDYFKKRDLVSQFFSADETDAARAAVLTGYDVQFVFYGPDEKALGTFTPSTDPQLTPVYARAGVTIYRVGSGG